MKHDSYDYVIVGAGVSGVYAAWRILKNAHDSGSDIPSIKIVERNNRVGGRLLSLEPPGVPRTRLEIGGMRYSDAHRWVCSLTEYLELAYQPLPADRPENIAFVRGELLRYQDRKDPSKIPYNVAPSERSPEALSSLMMLSAQRAIKEITGDENAKPTPETWESVRYSGRYHGEKLQDLPMRYVLLNTVSHEAFQMIEDIGGYNSVLHTWNVIDGYPWNLGDFAHPVKFHHCINGFDQVPKKLAAMAQDMGAELALETTVNRVEKHDDFEITIESAKDETMIRSKNLILAAPLRSIEIINSANHFFWEPGTKQEAKYKCVTPIPLFKLALCYKSAWWQKLPAVDVPGEGELKITKGKSNTDLPIRQCYYWWTDKDSGHSVILIYDDGTAQQYWAGLRDKTEDRYPFNATDAGTSIQPTDWEEHSAPRVMAEEIHRQLLLMHGLEDDPDVPKPYAASYMDWGEDPYGGGANFWHVGVESISAAKAIVHPDPDKRLYVCGECWSHDQGWVEGSLKTCEDMLQNHLGLKAPSWYKPNGDKT